jgi:hypothetical protein
LELAEPLVSSARWVISDQPRHTAVRPSAALAKVLTDMSDMYLGDIAQCRDRMLVAGELCAKG